MAGQIRITPEELRSGATYLEGQKNDCMNCLSNMKGKIEEVASNWEGASQNAFVEKFNELYKSISEALPQTVEGIEEMLKSTADTLERADEEISSALRG